MSDAPPNISALDFDSIKASLIEYLKNNTNGDLNSYNYSGSAINTLLDVFAYNTLYYAYYANMIANEMFLETAQNENNFISLLKPLGFLLPSRTCSSANISAISIGASATVVGYTDYFIGTTSTGTTYRFYTIEDITLTSFPSTFKVYEANTVVKDFAVTPDLTTQSVFIATKDLDIRTIRVKVKTGGTTETWSLYNNTTPVGPDAKVFFIDRTNTGFYILFGKRTINDFGNNYGKTLTAANEVFVSYLVPSGEVANTASSFSETGSTVSVTSSSVSGGGRLTPDLDAYRFSVPKMFASNDRAVTKDDYYGILLTSGLLPPNIENQDQLNIWGGEEAVPPAYGRVFISFADPTLSLQSFDVKNCISFLKKKCPVTILPEYVQPQGITANINLNIGGTITPSNISSLKTTINAFYNTPLKFNNEIVFSDIRSIVTTQIPAARSINLDSVSLSLNVYGSQTDRTIFYRNQLFSPPASTSYSVVKTTNISNYPDPIPGNPTNTTTVFFGDFPTTFDSDGNSVSGVLYPYRILNSSRLGTAEVGTVDYVNGIVTIYGNTITQTAPITITAKTENPDSLTFNGEFLLIANTKINGL